MCKKFIFMKTLASEEKSLKGGGLSTRKSTSTRDGIIDLCLALRDKVAVI